MRSEYDIARRMYYSSSSHRTARPAVRVAMAGITISMVVMILTICIVVGFKETITDKVAGFGAHIQVVSFDNNNTYEYQPILAPDSLLYRLASLKYVREVNTFATKPGMLKTDDSFQGIVLKGLPERLGVSDGELGCTEDGADAWSFFAANLTEGELPVQANDILLSKLNASRLKVGVGDRIYCYFLGDALKVRRFTIVGVFDTSFSEYDELFVLCAQTTVQQLNGWPTDEVSGIEMRLDNLSHLDEAYDEVYFSVANDLDENGGAYYPQSLMQTHPAIFYWLDLLDMNVLVIICLMLAVSVFNIISGLIILILDAIPLIGILKALGANNRFIRHIFTAEAMMLIGRGMLIGNIIGLALAALQYFFHLIPLDGSMYYVNFVPISFPWLGLLLLNLLFLAVSLLALFGPTTIATRVSPAKVMHFE